MNVFLPKKPGCLSFVIAITCQQPCRAPTCLFYFGYVQAAAYGLYNRLMTLTVPIVLIFKACDYNWRKLVTNWRACSRIAVRNTFARSFRYGKTVMHNCMLII